jgi:hypothetical protein
MVWQKWTLIQIFHSNLLEAHSFVPFNSLTILIQSALIIYISDYDLVTTARPRFFVANINSQNFCCVWMYASRVELWLFCIEAIFDWKSYRRIELELARFPDCVSAFYIIPHTGINLNIWELNLKIIKEELWTVCGALFRNMRILKLPNINSWQCTLNQYCFTLTPGGFKLVNCVFVQHL